MSDTASEAADLEAQGYTVTPPATPDVDQGPVQGDESSTPPAGEDDTAAPVDPAAAPDDAVGVLPPLYAGQPVTEPAPGVTQGNRVVIPELADPTTLAAKLSAALATVANQVAGAATQLAALSQDLQAAADTAVIKSRGQL